MATELDERTLEQLYTWIDSIPLSRPKKDLKRDFSDGGMKSFYKVPKLTSHPYQKYHGLLLHVPWLGTIEAKYNLAPCCTIL